MPKSVRMSARHVPPTCWAIVLISALLKAIISATILTAECSPFQRLLTNASQVVDALDMVLWIRIATQMEPFSWFVSQILYPISVACALWPLVAICHLRGEIPESNKSFPKWRFALLAVMGTAMNWGMAIFSGLLDGTLQAVLAKSATVVVMAQSSLILQTRYEWTHGLACLMMLLAAVIGAIPAIEEPPEKGQGERSAGDTAVGLVLFACVISIPKRVRRALP